MDDFGYDDDFESNEEKQNEYYVERSILFLIDGNEEMFENNFFMECLESYKNIVRQKCSENKKEKLGLFMFGTKKTNCDIDNVMILQKFDTVTIDFLNNIKNIMEHDFDKYKQMMSTSKYCLFDVLSYAFQVVHATKIKTNTRYIILLCTCNDNPCYNNSAQELRINHLVSSFKDNQTELHVVGFSNNWDDEIFYKSLQIASGISLYDYRRISLKDFEDNILSASRGICKLPWRISSEICIQVTLFNLVATPKYPSKIKLESEDNEILDVCSVLYQDNTEDSQSQNLREIKKDKKVVDNKNIMYYKSVGGVDIGFKHDEYNALKNLGLEPGIEILGFKSIFCDPLYHVSPAYFVTYNKYCNEESKIFFMCLISKCTSKKLMAICKVITKYAVLICQMIPSEDNGGFYMYKMPYNDNVRDLDVDLAYFKFNDEECPVNEEAVDVFKELMELSKIEFDPGLFKNPKLERCIAHIEALALDDKLDCLPPDTTLPPPSNDEAKNLEQTLIDSFKFGISDEPSKKESIIDKKKLKLSIVDMAKQKRLHMLTVPDLKDFLKSVQESAQGTKAVLMQKVYKYFESAKDY